MRVDTRYTCTGLCEFCRMPKDHCPKAHKYTKADRIVFGIAKIGALGCIVAMVILLGIAKLQGKW